MRKYNYTEEERAQIADARKNDKKGLAKLVNKIRKQCIAENRFTEVEDVHSAKPKAKEESADKEDESAVEVHGVSETSVIIK